jgi:RES domain-containing protein
VTPPTVVAIRQDDSHRLIPSHRADRSVLASVAANDPQVDDLLELEGATNDRLLGEANLLPGIGVHELLFGVAYSHIVNASFTHANPLGGRFNGAERGAWYAAFEASTAYAEVAFHKALELREVRWPEPETFTFVDYLADFRSDFHDLRDAPAYAHCLNPSSYLESQALADELLAIGSAGIVYPSVRRPKGTCLVCFRPALVTNVREGPTVTLKFRDAYSPPDVVTGSLRRRASSRS